MLKPVIYSKATDFTLKPCQNKAWNFYKTSSQPSVCRKMVRHSRGKSAQCQTGLCRECVIPGFPLLWMPASTTGILSTTCSTTQQSTHCTIWCSQTSVMCWMQEPCLHSCLVGWVNRLKVWRWQFKWEFQDGLSSFPQKSILTSLDVH